MGKQTVLSSPNTLTVNLNMFILLYDVWEGGYKISSQTDYINSKSLIMNKLVQHLNQTMLSSVFQRSAQKWFVTIWWNMNSINILLIFVRVFFSLFHLISANLATKSINGKAVTSVWIGKTKIVKRTKCKNSKNSSNFQFRPI